MRHLRRPSRPVALFASVCGAATILLPASVAAGAAEVIAAATAASAAYCPYVVTAHYASAYSQPSIHSRIYDAIPHGAQILASVSTVSGSGGPFRQMLGAGALAYVISDTVTRRSGVCIGSDHSR